MMMSERAVIVTLTAGAASGRQALVSAKHSQDPQPRT